MKQKKLLIVVAWLAASNVLAASAPQPYRAGAPPAWVIVAPDAPFQAAAKPVEAGESDYLLVDQQVRLSKTTDRYSRYVERLVNQGAVNSSASISISIDPGHEFVWLHGVRVFRDGQVLDKLADARRSLLNREEELDRRLINGRVTLHLLLQDVRIGDVLDYSFTTERTDPISERGYNEWFGTQWTVPVRHARVRVVRPADRELQRLDLSGLVGPIEAFRSGWIETTWEGEDIAGLPNETGRPAWDYRYPRLEFSEFADWNAVRQWAQPMYAVAATKDARLAAQIAELRTKPEGEERILAALRFVQDDIRYTGLEIGAGAWRPTQPAEVLARRFGDCKDKVLMLVTLLRAAGIEAWPALVNSAAGNALESRLPGPAAFDHVIAKVHWLRRDYWLEATASGQGGRLDSLVQANYGAALVLDGTNRALESMPAREIAAPTSHVLETYDLSNGADRPAKLIVHTILRDADADLMRVRMRSTTATQLGKEYIDYYRKRYSGIRSTQTIRLADDRDGNVFTIDEAYEIDAPFKQESDGARRFSIEAYLVTERARPPEQAARTSPLALPFPLHVRQEIVAYLPEGWRGDDENISVSDPAFEYRSTARFHGHKVDLSYDLLNKRDHVPVEQLGEFLTKIGKTRDDSFYTFTDTESTPKAGPGWANGLNFALILAMGMGLGAGVLLSTLLARSRWKLPPAEPGAPQGLAGWMIVPAFGMGASAIYLLYTVCKWFGNFGRAASFERLGATMQWLLLCEFLVICALLTLVMYGLRQMLQRHRTFPFTFIVVQALGLAMLLFDRISLAMLGLPDAAPELRPTVLRVLSAALWISYMLVSERVRATFVNSRGGVDTPALQPAPAG